MNSLRSARLSLAAAPRYFDRSYDDPLWLDGVRRLDSSETVPYNLVILAWMLGATVCTLSGGGIATGKGGVGG